MELRVYSLSHVLSGRFDFGYAPLIDAAPAQASKLTYGTTGGQKRYGLTLFKTLDKILPQVWDFSRIPDLDNSNSNKLRLGWYIDGYENFIQKHLLPIVSSYAITESPLSSSVQEKPQLYIQKPSHPFIGSGKLITVSQDREALIKARVKDYKIGGRNYSIEHWIIQPLIQPLLWEGRKFDCRFFGVVFSIGSKVYATSLDFGVARLCVNKYNPRDDPLTAITNISVQEKIPGYNSKDHLLLIRDDTNIVSKILEELIVNTELFPTENYHLVVLGFDIMFSWDAKPLLIEVNHEPHLELTVHNAEQYCSMQFVSHVFGELIPSMIRNQSVPPSEREFPQREFWGPVIQK
jgi:hypothetical protein